MKTIKAELGKLFEINSSNAEINNIIKRGYVCANNTYNKEILFVGINPSYTKNAISRSYFYDISEAIINYPKHYKHFDDLISNTKYKNNWTYIDLFYFRETNQSKIDLLIKHNINFIVEQLIVTNKIIKKINPKIIIVANSKAHNFFGVNKFMNSKGYLTNIWYGFNFEFDNQTGLMKVKSIENNSIIDNSNINFYKDKYFLFTSTLKYKNKFDKMRLSWLINRI